MDNCLTCLNEPNFKRSNEEDERKTVRITKNDLLTKITLFKCDRN